MNEIYLQSRPLLAPRVRLRIDTVRQEPVLLFPEGILALSPTAHEIVIRCDGHNTVEMIIDLLGEEFEASEEILLQDVFDTLEDLLESKLIILDP